MTVARETAVPQPAVSGNRAAAEGARLALVLLIALCIAWEWQLAPLRAGGSLLVLKAVPLLLALPGVWRKQLYTLQWASMLSLLYLMEGIVRGMSDRGLGAPLGWCEALLASGFFVCALVYVAPFKRAAKRHARNEAPSDSASNSKAGSRPNSGPA